MCSNFKEAIEYVHQAVHQDYAGSYAKALPLYMSSLEYFKTHLKYEKNPKIKEVIAQRCTEYFRRAEEIRGVLEGGGPGPGLSGDAAVATRPKTKPKNGEGGDGEDLKQAKLRPINQQPGCDDPSNQFDLAKILDEIGKLDPAVLDEIRKLDPAVLLEIRKFDPAVIDDLRRLCLKENKQGEEEEEEAEADGSSSSYRGEPSVAPILQLNFLGLPIRPGKKECQYYMQNASCMNGKDCEFNHPDPTATGESDPPSGYGNGGPTSSQGASSSAAAPWSTPRSLNDAPFYSPLLTPPYQGFPSQNTEWNGYQEMDPNRGRGRGRRGRGRGRGRGRAVPANEVVPETANEVPTAKTPFFNVKMDAQTATFFAEFMGTQGQRTTTHAPSVQPPVDEVRQPLKLYELLRELMRVGAQPFPGTTDCIEADQWIQDFKNHFEVVECTEVEKRKIATYLLQKDARFWWDSVKRARDVTNMNWDEFEVLFYGQYFPNIVKEKFMIAFLELEQGSMTVREYEAKFVQLYRFSYPLTPIELTRKFERGLNAYIRKDVVSNRLSTLQDVVASAIAVEQYNKRFRKIQDEKKDLKGKAHTPAESSRNFSQQDKVWKKQRYNNPTPPRVVAPTLYAEPRRCYKCNETGHFANNCTKLRAGVCDTYGQTSHYAKDCTQ